MPSHQFYTRNPIINIDAGSSAVTSGTVSGAAFDITGYDGVCFVTTIVTTSTGNLLKAQGGTASGAGAMSDLAGTQTTGQTTCLQLEIRRPDTRFVKAQLILQGTSSKYGPIYAFGLGPRSSTSVNSTLVTTKFVAYAATGTATSS